MEALLLMLDAILFVVVAFWAIKNDSLRSSERVSGLFRFKIDKDDARKNTAKFPKHHANA